MTELPALIKRTLDQSRLRPGYPLRGGAFGALLRVLDPTFDPNAHGFTTLKQLLVAFPDVVSVEHDGIDIVVRDATPAVPEAPMPARAAVATANRVRSDFWQAVTHYRPQADQYYDRNHDSILEVTEASASDAEKRTVRAAPDRFVRIEPLANELRLQFMRQFVDRDVPPDHPLGERLREAVAGPFWFREFRNVLRPDPVLNALYTRTFTAHVVSHLRQWEQRCGLVVPDLIDGPSERRVKNPGSAVTRGRGVPTGRAFELVAFPDAQILYDCIVYEYNAGRGHEPNRHRETLCILDVARVREHDEAFFDVLLSGRWLRIEGSTSEFKAAWARARAK